MNTPLVITIPGPPGTKRRIRTSGRQFFKDDKTRGEETWITACALSQIGRPVIEGPIALTISIGFPIPASWSKAKREAAMEGTLRPTGKPDLDNSMKALKDALNGIVWKDDAQVVDAFVSKRYVERPETTITIEVAV